MNSDAIKIVERIKAATEKSPILVMATNVPGQLWSGFAATVESRTLIEADDPRIIGVFHRGMDIEAIHQRLHEVAG